MFTTRKDIEHIDPYETNRDREDRLHKEGIRKKLLDYQDRALAYGILDADSMQELSELNQRWQQIDRFDPMQATDSLLTILDRITAPDTHQ